MLGPELLLDLTRRYCEPHRRYHTIGHIADMLWRGRALKLDDTQLAAIWYHDAIYDVRRSDNEARSAKLAHRQLGAAGWSEERAAQVARIVLDTAGHRPSCRAAAAVLDLDLAALAAPPAVFDANTADIRAEYAHVADADFNAGRARFYADFLARPRLYHTAWGARLEAPARANLRRALWRS